MCTQWWLLKSNYSTHSLLLSSSRSLCVIVVIVFLIWFSMSHHIWHFFGPRAVRQMLAFLFEYFLHGELKNKRSRRLYKPNTFPLRIRFNIVNFDRIQSRMDLKTNGIKTIIISYSFINTLTLYGPIFRHTIVQKWFQISWKLIDTAQDTLHSPLLHRTILISAKKSMLYFCGVQIKFVCTVHFMNCSESPQNTIF